MNDHIQKQVARNMNVALRNHTVFLFHPNLRFHITDNTYSSDGIRLSCDAPMRRWRLAFNGIVIEAGTSHKVLRQ